MLVFLTCVYVGYLSPPRFYIILLLHFSHDWSNFQHHHTKLCSKCNNTLVSSFNISLICRYSNKTLHNTYCKFAHNSVRVLQGNYWCTDYIMCLYGYKYRTPKRLLFAGRRHVQDDKQERNQCCVCLSCTLLYFFQLNQPTRCSN